MSKLKIGDRVAINPKIENAPQFDGNGTGRIVDESTRFPSAFTVLTNTGDVYEVPSELMVKVPEISIFQLGDLIVASCDDENIVIENADFYKGSKTALNKLITEMTQPYNAQVVCIKSDDCLFKVGKVYQVENGFLKSDHLIINKTAYRNFKALESDITTAKFIQLVD